MSGFCGMFSQLLNLFPRAEFRSLGRAPRARVHTLGSGRGDVVLPVRPRPLAAEICGGLRNSEGELTHFNITAPNRSTLAYANAHRSWQLYCACSTLSWPGVSPWPRATGNPLIPEPSW